MTIAFIPDAKAHVKEESAISLLCRPFRSHEAGLPEWVKNSSDAYARAGSAPSDAPIVLIFKDGRGQSPSLVGCLDFVGMTTEDVEGKFRQWADPDASGSNENAAVEGGHGNGGKCYMTQMFGDYAQVWTVKDGRRNRYGFVAGSFKSGYFPDPANGRGAAASPRDEFDAALGEFSLSYDDLPAEVQNIFSLSHAFTLVYGVRAKGVHSRLPWRQWLESLRSSHQLVRVLQRTRIFAFANGKLAPHADPLRLPEITPIPGASMPRIVSVPSSLTDPMTGEAVETAATSNDRLELRTSNVSMRHSLKARHHIAGWTLAGRPTGLWDMQDLSRSSYGNKIYGDLYLDALSDFQQNDRRNHSDAPLTRALKEWLSSEVEIYASDFVQQDRLAATEQERSELSRMNELLNRWKNDFLEEEFGGTGGASNGDTAGAREPAQALPRGEPARVELRFTHTHAGIDISFKPTLHFFDDTERRIRPVAFRWVSSDWAVASFDGDLNMVTTHKPGIAEFHVECSTSGLRSNATHLHVIDIAQILLAPTTLSVPAGSRAPLVASAVGANGERVEGVYLDWTEGDAEIARVGSGGMVFGIKPGTTFVSASDQRTVCVESASITVSEADPKDAGSGDGFPRILLSEIDVDPLGEAPPQFTHEEPAVHQRPQDVDHNIWWINMASPLARRYVDDARGGGARSKEWRVYLLERYIEVMVKIKLSYDFAKGAEPTFETMMREWDDACVVMQQRATESLSEFLDEGIVPAEFV